MEYLYAKLTTEKFRNPYKGKLIQNNTRLYMEESTKNIYLKLHNTNIITWKPNGDIILNTGGWQTVTTKDRMNRYTPQGYYICQQKGEWFLTTRMGTFEYQDGINLNQSKLEFIFNNKKVS